MLIVRGRAIRDVWFREAGITNRKWPGGHLSPTAVAASLPVVELERDVTNLRHAQEFRRQSLDQR